MKWDTPKQHLRKLKFERFVGRLKVAGVVLLILMSFWVLYATLSGWDIPDRLNECYKTHSQMYCNKHIG